MKTNIGERIRVMRKTRDWSQTDVASRTGLKPSAISHFETGRRTPSVGNLIRLADVLNCSLDDLVGREVRR
jgi:transcriptional regulator with XRE-family HTH domain